MEDKASIVTAGQNESMFMDEEIVGSSAEKKEEGEVWGEEYTKETRKGVYVITADDDVNSPPTVAQQKGGTKSGNCTCTCVKSWILCDVVLIAIVLLVLVGVLIIPTVFFVVLEPSLQVRLSAYSTSNLDLSAVMVVFKVYSMGLYPCTYTTTNSKMPGTQQV